MDFLFFIRSDSVLEKDLPYVAELFFFFFRPWVFSVGVFDLVKKKTHIAPRFTSVALNLADILSSTLKIIKTKYYQDHFIWGIQNQNQKKRKKEKKKKNTS